MKKIAILLLVTLLISVNDSVYAQKKKATKRNKERTEVREPKMDVSTDTIQTNRTEPGPQGESIDNPLVVQYYYGGYVKDGKIHLLAKNEYDSIDLNTRSEIMQIINSQFSGKDIVVHYNNTSGELWIPSDKGVQNIGQWSHGKLILNDYLPLSSNNSGTDRWFYGIGGSLSGNSEMSSGNLNLSVGTFLLKKIIDGSITLNLGYNHSERESKFAGDLGLATRIYITLKNNKLGLVPYAGAGVSWIFAPEMSFEPRLLVGGSWFLKKSSIDFGIQYGTKSKSSFIIGYTFRP